MAIFWERGLKMAPGLKNTGMGVLHACDLYSGRCRQWNKIEVLFHTTCQRQKSHVTCKGLNYELLQLVLLKVSSECIEKITAHHTKRLLPLFMCNWHSQKKNQNTPEKNKRIRNICQFKQLIVLIVISEVKLVPSILVIYFGMWELLRFFLGTHGTQCRVIQTWPLNWKQRIPTT